MKEEIKLSVLIRCSEKAGIIDTPRYISRFVKLHPEVTIVNDLKNIK